MAKYDSLLKKAGEIKHKNLPFTLDCDAFYGLTERIAGKKYRDFIKVEKIDSPDGFDAYEIENGDGFLTIRATSGSAAATAFSRYLKDACGYRVSINFTTGTLPENPPYINKKISEHSRFHYRYFLNYCTYGYSYAFYDWDGFENVLDRIIMNGYNLILNPVGQEAVWYDFLTSCGYSDEDARSFLVGPAFMAWLLMGNFSGYKGGYSKEYLERRRTLAGKINLRMQEFGCGTVIPGFIGMVPDDFEKYVPGSNPKHSGLWCGLPRPACLMEDSPVFKEIARKYYKAQRTVNGTDGIHYYGVDPFHEGKIPESCDAEALAKLIFEVMCENDADSVWVFQGWQENPHRRMLKVLPRERLLVENLLAETNFDGGDNFADTPWIFCGVDNFGGQHALRGEPKIMLERPFDALDNDKNCCVGIGYMPESVETDEIFFDIVGYNSFNGEKTLLRDYLRQFTFDRYGYTDDCIVEAWNTLALDVYDKRTYETTHESALLCRPSLEVNRVSTWSRPSSVVDNQKLMDAVKTLIKYYDKLKDNEAYIYDITDFARQLLADDTWKQIYGIQKAYKEKNYPAFCKNADELMHRYDVMEELLSACKQTLFGTWLKYPEKLAADQSEKAWLMWNARTIITVWAPKDGDELHDYAAREYSGLLTDFYRKRWERFINNIKISFYTGAPLDNFDNYSAEEVFNFESKSYPTVPSGDTLKAIEKILNIKNIGTVKE